MEPLRLRLSPGARTAFACLNVLPVPGAGAMLAGWRNPHTRLVQRGLLQLALVAASYPWVVPGVVGFVWAVRDAVRIAKADLVQLPAAEPAAEGGA